MALHVRPEAILVHPQVSDRAELLAQLVGRAVNQPELLRQPELREETMLAAVLAREDECPTGLGYGLAIPHARLPGLRSPAIAFALLNPALDFGATDGEPSDIICLLIVPEDAPQIALQVMAHFSEFLLDATHRQELRSLRDPVIVANYLQANILASQSPILARDIMRPARTEVRPDTPLREVTRRMLAHGADCVSVADENGVLQGVITSDDLFKSGMPPFFQQLRTVSFIREYDPFARYFEGESAKLAADVMTQDYAAVAEDDTLIEVVFLLAVKRYPKVYVLRDGVRVGVIDRFVVLERVVNF